VAVGRTSSVGRQSAGGGNGLNALAGLTKIVTYRAVTSTKTTSKMAVRIFQTESFTSTRPFNETAGEIAHAFFCEYNPL
jgi:hypothetical protein